MGGVTISFFSVSPGILSDVSVVKYLLGYLTTEAPR